jgi:tetratricopeptide (TPR) repeat protein
MSLHLSRNDSPPRRSTAFASRGLLIVLLIFQLAGCAFIRSGPVIQAPGAAPLKATVDAVPFYAQKKYQCGPAALAMVLQWSGIPITPDDLVPAVYTPGRKGSLQLELISAARRHDRLAYSIQGISCLIREVAAGRPVVVLQNLGLSWLPRWHYAVVIGYDLNSQFIVLHTGDRAARQVGLRTFLKTWQRADQWGLSILPPGRMPVCAEESAYLKAVLGLQQAGQSKSAKEAFSAAVDRWPDSAQAYLALGNALYEDGSLQEAIQALSHAVQIEPANGPALNNLAHLLAESGDLKSAEVMARRAIAIGGAYQEVYRRTLEEISLKRSTRLID